MKHVVFGLFLLCCYVVVSAQQVFKCKDDSGAIVYSQTPCSGEAIDFDLPESSVVPSNNHSNGNRNSSIYGSQSQAYSRSNQGGLSTHDRRRLSSLKSKLNAVDWKIGQLKRWSDPKKAEKLRKERSSLTSEITTIAQSINSQTPYSEKQVTNAERELDQVRATLERKKPRDNWDCAKTMCKAEFEERQELATRESTLERQIAIQRGVTPHSEPSRAGSSRQVNSYKDQENTTSAFAKPAAPINQPATTRFGTKGEAYFPTNPDGTEYLRSSGGFCRKEGPNLNCNGVIKPAVGDHGPIIDK